MRIATVIVMSLALLGFGQAWVSAHEGPSHRNPAREAQDADEADDDLDDAGELKGLDRAEASVLGNLERARAEENEHAAKGLENALERIRANRERQEARREAWERSHEAQERARERQGR